MKSDFFKVMGCAIINEMQAARIGIYAPDACGKSIMMTKVTNKK
jgi:flagellar biosynthesis/type III secretory pathway ATPase